VSTHLYPQDEYVNYPHRKGSEHKPGEFFIDTVRDVQRQVAKSSRPDLEIHWTEWNSLSAPATGEVSWTRNDSVDSLRGAAVVCHNCIALDSTCDTLCWWVATDIFEEVGLPQSEFSCTYGLVTLNGLPKATFHAFEFLKRLGPQRIAVRRDGPLPTGCGCCAGTTSETLQLLIWHKIVPEKEAQEAWKTRVTMPIAEKGDYVLIESRIASGHGSAWETWTKLGRPQNPSVEEMRLLRNHAQPKCDFSVFPKAESIVSFDLQLAPGEVCFLELRRQGPAAAPKVASRQELAKWEQQMSAASKA
jgi:xylan 1,4-beta-xylosidase